MLAFVAEAWQQGVAEFNQRRYWHAHEHWEIGWTKLPDPMKTYVQALIQVAGAFHLFEKGRTRPAWVLCRSALEKRRKTVLLIQPFFPRLEIQGVEGALREIIAHPDRWRTIADSLQACLLLTQD